MNRPALPLALPARNENLDPPSGLRRAVVLAWGAGHPPATLVVAINGVREISTETGSRYWVLAGQEGVK